jgi:2-amino-4,5-dihydroxy-6-oxo-7-(phosphonooxy)heptanoate synthase
MNTSFARKLRLERMFRGGQHLLVVPLDHSITDGPTGHAVTDLVGQVCENGADAVVLHKGSLRHVDPRHFAQVALFVHLSASTCRGSDPDAKFLVAGVEEALRLGADGVSVHVNLGSRGESRQIADLAAVGEACDRWNLPLLAMVYPRGPNIRDPNAPELVAHAVTIASDLGADMVKTVFPGSVDALAAISRHCPIPILIAGGRPSPAPDAILARVRDARDGGAIGVAIGRTIFRASDPGAMTRKIADAVHAAYESIPRGETW